ncbi:MAG: DUF2242 domain-containing protein [Vitreoscilla sp.]|nr:DUF2242 domain-containing protein [Vitreoscilla sp.]
MKPRSPVCRRAKMLAALALSALASACVSTPPKQRVYQTEGFESTETFSRLFDAPVSLTCEAARRALLSQGYVLSTVKADAINGQKAFQPEGEVHVQIQFNVVCAPEGPEGRIATAYVNAIQESYALKKNPNSASVGLSAIGSLSIPLSSSSDSMVKVASETIPAGPFYDRFFALMQRYLREQAE